MGLSPVPEVADEVRVQHLELLCPQVLSKVLLGPAGAQRSWLGVGGQPCTPSQGGMDQPGGHHAMSTPALQKRPVDRSPAGPATTGQSRLARPAWIRMWPGAPVISAWGRGHSDPVAGAGTDSPWGLNIWGTPHLFPKRLTERPCLGLGPRGCGSWPPGATDNHDRGPGGKGTWFPVAKSPGTINTVQ